MSRRWLKLAESGENAALLSAAASLIAEEYLAENDLPRSVESEITPIGLATQTLVCWEGPNKGMPYGGGPRGLLDSGTFETYSQAAKDLDTEDNELSSRTGIQMIALKSLWRTCYETLDWLSQVQKLSAEAAAR